MGELIPHDPFQHMSVIRKKMNALFDELFSFGEFFESRLSGLNSGISIDLSDTGAELVVKAHLPGVDTKNLDIHVEEDVVTLKGSYSEETRQEGQEYLLQQFRAGSFIRTIPLNALVLPEKAKAKFQDGILELTLPKSGEKKARGVKLNIE